MYTVGLFVLLPLQYYFELFTNSGYRGNFWQVIPRYFADFNPPLITSLPDTLLPIPFSGHLWFIQYLFLISLVTLPVIFYLKSEQGQCLIERLAVWYDCRGGIFLFVIPLVLVRICLGFLFNGASSFTDFFWYAIFFVIGYMIAADNRFTEAIKRYGWVCLTLWLVGFFVGTCLLIVVFGYDPTPGYEPFSPMFVLFQVLWGIISWSAVVFMLYIGARCLNSNYAYPISTGLSGSAGLDFACALS